MAKAHRALRIVNDQFGSPTYTVDLTMATLRLIDAEAKGIFHLTNSGITNWYDFTAATFREFGIIDADLAPVTTSEWLAMRPKQAHRPAFSALECGRYGQATGHAMRPWPEALRDYHAVYNEP